MFFASVQLMSLIWSAYTSSGNPVAKPTRGFAAQHGRLADQQAPAPLLFGTATIVETGSTVKKEGGQRAPLQAQGGMHPDLRERERRARSFRATSRLNSEFTSLWPDEQR